MTSTVPPRAPVRPGPARTPRPVHVAVEFTRASAAQLARMQPPPGMTRAQLAELARLEPRVLDHLARTPAARAQMLTDPASVLRAAAPDTPAALLAAVGTAHRGAPAIPAGLRPDRFAYGVAGRIPLPALAPAVAPQPTAAAGSLGGFDACLAIGAGALGRALADLLGPLLGPPNGTLVELPIPVLGTLRVTALTFDPTAVLDVANGRVRVEATAAAELDPAVGPTLPVTLEIGIDLSIVVDGQVLRIDEAGIDVQVLGLDVPLGDLLAIVTDAVRSVFPRTAPLDLPGGDPDFCDIGLRNVAVGVLAGTPGSTDPCLAVLTGLLPDSATDVGALASPLPAGRDAGVFLDNFFLLTEIACEVQHSPQLPGLPDPPTHVPARSDPAPFFEWAGAEIEQEVNGETIVVTRVRLDIDATTPADKAFLVAADLTIVRALFEADVSLQVPVTLVLENGEITPVVGEPSYTVRIRLTPLGIFLAIAVGVVLAAVAGVVAAIISGITAALIAGAVTGGVYAVVVLLIVRAIRKAVGNAIKDAVAGQAPAGVRVIPQAVVDLFGVLDVVDLVFDDLELHGTLTIAPPEVVLRRDTLDRQQVEAGGGVFHLATTVRFTALPRRLEVPVAYQWRFGTRAAGGVGGKGGTVLSTGAVPPGSGIATVVVDGATCRITSALGADVDSTVSVRATDATGRTVTRSAPLHLDGSVTVPVDELPGGKPDPRFPETP